MDVHATFQSETFQSASTDRMSSPWAFSTPAATFIYSYNAPHPPPQIQPHTCSQTTDTHSLTLYDFPASEHNPTGPDRRALFFSHQILVWPNRDPIEVEGGINLYVFVGNDWVNYHDILGLNANCCGGQSLSAGQSCCNDRWTYDQDNECCLCLGVAQFTLDDAGRSCCPSEITTVTLYVTPGDRSIRILFGSRRTGHTFLGIGGSCHSNQSTYGLVPGPGGWKRNTEGRIGDQSGYIPRVINQQDFRACPETAGILNNNIQDDISSLADDTVTGPTYSLNPFSSGEQCTTWSQRHLRDAGFTGVPRGRIPFRLNRNMNRR